MTSDTHIARVMSAPFVDLRVSPARDRKLVVQVAAPRDKREGEWTKKRKKKKKEDRVRERKEWSA